MKKLSFVKSEHIPTSFRWREDVLRIVDICYHNGYLITDVDAELAWEEYSDSLCAGWLGLSDNDDIIFNIVMKYCKVDEE